MSAARVSQTSPQKANPQTSKSTTKPKSKGLRRFVGRNTITPPKDVSIAKDRLLATPPITSGQDRRTIFTGKTTFHEKVVQAQTEFTEALQDAKKELTKEVFSSRTIRGLERKFAQFRLKCKRALERFLAKVENQIENPPLLERIQRDSKRETTHFIKSTLVDIKHFFKTHPGR